jgi:hypothetical protein
MTIRRAAALLAGCAASLTLAVPAQAAVPTADLVRYWSGAKHWSTTGEAPGGKYRAEGAVKVLARPAAGAVPIYGCMAGHAKLDQFLSLRRDCEGENNGYLRLEGYVYTRPTGAFKLAIYRCHWAKAQSHFYSIKADCESTPTTRVTAEGRIGYVQG